MSTEQAFTPYRAIMRPFTTGEPVPVLVTGHYGDLADSSASVVVLPHTRTADGYRAGDRLNPHGAWITAGHVTLDIDAAVSALTYAPGMRAATAIADTLTVAELRAIADLVHADTHGARKALTARVVSEVRA